MEIAKLALEERDGEGKEGEVVLACVCFQDIMQTHQFKQGKKTLFM